MEFPRLVELHEKYEELGVQFVSIDTGAGGAQAESFIEEIEDPSRDRPN